MKKADFLKHFDKIHNWLWGIDEALSWNNPVRAYKKLQNAVKLLRELRTKMDETDWFCMSCGSFNTSSSYPICEGCGLDVTLSVGDKTAEADK